MSSLSMAGCCPSQTTKHLSRRKFRLIPRRGGCAPRSEVHFCRAYQSWFCCFTDSCVHRCAHPDASDEPYLRRPSYQDASLRSRYSGSPGCVAHAFAGSQPVGATGPDVDEVASMSDGTSESSPCAVGSRCAWAEPIRPQPEQVAQETSQRSASSCRQQSSRQIQRGCGRAPKQPGSIGKCHVPISCLLRSSAVCGFWRMAC